jgi:hypothetical protein
MIEDDDREEFGFGNSSYTNRQNQSLMTNLAGFARVQFKITCNDFNQTWYHKKVNRDTAEKILSGQKEGTFLIRPSSQRGCYAISFVSPQHEVEHNIIYNLFPGYSLGLEGPSSSSYETLSELVSNQQHLSTAYSDDSDSSFDLDELCNQSLDQTR